MEKWQNNGNWHTAPNSFSKIRAWWYDLKKIKKILVQVGYSFFQEKKCYKL